MRRLSWSQFNKHEHCPFDWYAVYVLRVVPYKKNIHFQVGSAIHSAIQFALENWNKGTRKTIPEMVGMFADYLRNDGIRDPDTLQYWILNAQNMLLGWYRWVSTQDLYVEAVERRIKIKGFSGVIDCIAMIDNQRYIIDWKTSTPQYTQKRVDKDRQVTVYKWLDGAKDDTKVAYGILLKGTSKFQFLVSERTEEDIQVFLEDLAEIRRKIQTYRIANDPPKRIGAHCDRCDVYKVGMCDGRDDF